MTFRSFAYASAFICALPATGIAQSTEDNGTNLSVELNTLQDVGGACRLTFVARNGTEKDIEKAEFETVIFDTEGAVTNLSLFNFRDLPASRARVRQFQLPNRTCDTVGQVLINGLNACIIEGQESDMCSKALSLSTRVNVELLG